MIMKKEELIKATIGDIVTKDFRAAALFKEAGLDFCCGGKKSLGEACAEKNIPVDSLVSKVLELETLPPDRTHNFRDWAPSFLADYIVNTHHKYVLRTLPDLVFYTAKIAEVHGERHAELREVAGLFAKINEELLQHLGNEEQVLFPAVKRVQETGSAGDKAVIVSEISRMTGEHEFAGGAMDQINELTHGYLIPADACNTYAVTMKLLGEFEDDLHIHVHLENNILYPTAMNLAGNDLTTDTTKPL
jgi:regulator of cell morphogenesis and NO signaling